MTDKKGPLDSQSASPYAGRWVARLRGKIIAQGNTPEEARRAAQTHRHKESPEIVFMPSPFSFSPLLVSVHETLPPDQEIYLVGGAVRDALLGHESHDLDFAVPADGIKLARRVANKLKGAFYPLDDERDTGRVILTQEDNLRTIMDFATYRGSDIEADLRDRDFTINAISYNLQTETVFDPLNGANDVQVNVRVVSSTSRDLSGDIRTALAQLHQPVVIIVSVVRQEITHELQLLRRAVPLAGHRLHFRDGEGVRQRHARRFRVSQRVQVAVAVDGVAHFIAPGAAADVVGGVQAVLRPRPRVARLRILQQGVGLFYRW